MEKAKEFLNHGVCRRMKTLDRCMENVFRIFPPARTQLLGGEEGTDLEINLQAFVINTCGVLDNMAWVFLIERGLDSKFKRRQDVDLFKGSTQAFLPKSITDYLICDRTAEWHRAYAKGYRDALAHRIPLYVPPASILKRNHARYTELDREIRTAILKMDLALADKLRSEQDSLQEICISAIHSYDEAETVMHFHQQLIRDSKTVLEILRLFFQEMKVGPNLKP